MVAEPCSAEAACGRLAQLFQGESAQATCWRLFDLLRSGRGGCIVVIVSSAELQLRVSSVDNGRLRLCLQQLCVNIHDQAFEDILLEFRKVSGRDRWTREAVERLVSRLGAGGEARSCLGALCNEPKDGAFVVGLDGKVLAAAARLRHCDCSGQLLLAGGHSVGTRHEAALGVVQEMGESWRGGRAPGAVLVASDSGHLCVMIPQRQAAPKVFQVRGP